MNLIHNAFTENLGTDFVALNPAGIPVGRAGTREALEQAHAGADVQILDAAELARLTPTLAEAATAKLDGPFAAVVAQSQPPADNDHVAPGATPFTDEEIKLNAPTAEEQVAKMDPDGDGRIGGAPKGGNKKATAKK